MVKQLMQGIRVNLFSNDELYELHLATLELLQQTGVRVEHDKALDIFGGGGCIVDKKKKLVKIPPYVGEDAIHSVPGEILLAGRDPKNDVILGGNKINFTNFGEALMMVDPFTGERRESTKQDVANIALVTDALSEIDVTWRPCDARDVSPEVSALHVMEALLANTTKHIASGDGGEELTKVRIEMAAAVAGGKEKLRQRPLWTTVSCPASPLTLGKVQCGDVIESAMAEVPHIALSMGLSGGTSPVTLAGALVVHNAEILSEIVLSQLTRKGAPIIYGSSTTCMDLKTATTPVGSPELAVFSAAVVKLAQYYRLCSLVAGGLADSKVSDAQAGHEKTITALLPALAGANLIYGMGMLELGITFSLTQLIIDNEITKMVKAALRGIDVNDENIALGVIKQVGPGGNFLSAEHTLRHMREQSHSKLIDRRMWEQWEGDGKKDLAQRAAEEALSILKNHKPEPLPPETLSSLHSIVESAEEEILKKKKVKEGT